MVYLILICDIFVCKRNHDETMIKVKFGIMEETPYKNTKLPKQHHDKKTVNV